jgi:hypothetical protein
VLTRRRILASVLAALACAALLSSCSLLPDIPTPGNDDTAQKTDVVIQHIADAVKHHDVAALKKEFSPAAQAKATDLDGGLAYFLSFFPSGHMTWQIGGAGPGGTGENDLPNFSWEAFASYKVFADGKTYELFFPDVTTDTPHPEYLGIYALGIVPYSTGAHTASGAPKPFDLWAGQFDIKDHIPTGTPGVYRPGLPGTIIQDIGMTPEVEMQHIADAVKNHDVAALAKLFSARALQKATDLDAGLTYFLSAFPAGPVTWKPVGTARCYERGGYKTAGVANCSFYKLTAGEKEYELFFADFVVDQPDPSSIGIYALGIAPYTAGPGGGSQAPEDFTAWAGSHQPFPDGKISGPVGVYVPQG